MRVRSPRQAERKKASRPFSISGASSTQLRQTCVLTSHYSNPREMQFQPAQMLLAGLVVELMTVLALSGAALGLLDVFVSASCGRATAVQYVVDVLGYS